MKKLFALILVSLLAFAGCSEEEDILPDQRQKIVTYLTSTHNPRLVAQADLEVGSNQEFYAALGSTVYRYLPQYYNPDRANWRLVTETSVVTITFRAFVFNYTNLPTGGSYVSGDPLPYYTNDPLLEPIFNSIEYFDPAQWLFMPLTIDMRSGDILKGLRLALLGCRQGDTVEAYMTYNMAYGDKHFGIIPKESPIAYFFTINSVE